MTDAAEILWFDLALAVNPDTRKVDLVLGDDGDLAIDLTPAPAMLITIGSDRRARPDDALPTGITELNAPTSFIERRGWAGDALDAEGERIGARLWLLDRAKQSETTRLMAAEWLAEGFAWVEREGFAPAEIEVKWVQRDWLGYSVLIDGRTGRFAQPLGA